MNAGDPFITARTRDLVLDDGLHLRIRPVVSEDKQGIADGFEALSEESRFRRFMGAMSRLSAAHLEYLTELDYVNHFAWVAFAPDVPGAPGVGVARYVRLQEDPTVAEAAVAVVDAYHGRGIGTILLEALGEAALANGITTFTGAILAENKPIAHVLEGFDARFGPTREGETPFAIDLPAADERLDDSAIHAMLRAVARGEVPDLTPTWSGTLKHSVFSGVLKRRAR